MHSAEGGLQDTQTISQLLPYADGGAPGCGAFFAISTMPKPMATSRPHPAMSYQVSLIPLPLLPLPSPAIVALLPPPPPPPPPMLMPCHEE